MGLGWGWGGGAREGEGADMTQPVLSGVSGKSGLQ